ncbi:Protein of unknown function, partial [Gryllus bimaculatus]
MKRLNLLCLLFLICILSCAFLDAEAKSKDKNKEKYNKKYKTEGSPKEGKNKYSKNSQEYAEQSRKYKKQVNENLELNPQEDEPVEIVENQEPAQKPYKQKKEKKPYTISVELLEEPELTNGNKISSEEQIDSAVRKESKQKPIKRQGYQNTKKIQPPKPSAEDTADFIVHVPKKKKGTRQVLVFQVPAQDEQNEEEELANAVQQYVSDEQEATVEEDCGCEENTVEEKSSN